jgi:hypothetical protein
VRDDSIWFGRAGSLRRLWAPTGGTLATRDRDTSVFTNKNGGTRVTKALDGARQIVLNYGALGRANFEYLNQFAQGHMGAGPFILIDPGRRNMLTVNQSSATSQTGDTRGFTVSGAGGSISSDATGALPGPLPKVLKWSFSTSTPASASLTLNKPSSVVPGIPILVRQHTFWCMALASGSSVTTALAVDWLSIAGAVLATSTGSAVVVGTSTPVELSVTGTPPAAAVYALCRVAPTVATIAAGDALYLSQFMLQEGDQSDPLWVGGTGVYPVQFVAMPEKYGFDEPGMLVAPTVTLQEVR